MPVSYVSERERSEDLTRQLEEFLSLRGQEDQEDVWISTLEADACNRRI